MDRIQPARPASGSGTTHLARHTCQALQTRWRTADEELTRASRGPPTRAPAPSATVRRDQAQKALKRSS
eukprot:CAMPEP_0183339066 /NCGR_PEP_ID=MMETSP0164_2-20130417/6132_1 /TAXON_ID=221442 /ORGANISM="Coccolithus pelagicus ssp braarudi, Strain PLY182g" /LENGTH=68 /DNA_ID=CAMNT_0025509021 /DNA_START=332 /DNA_END=538 /DNA_ORIENTATION=+